MFENNIFVVAAIAVLLAIAALAVGVTYLHFRRARVLRTELKEQFSSLEKWWNSICGPDFGYAFDDNFVYLAEREKWSAERIFATAKARYAYQRADAYLNGHMYMFWQPAWHLEVAKLLLGHATYLLKFKEVSWEKVIFIDQVKEEGVISAISKLADHPTNGRVLLRHDGMIPIEALELEKEIYDAGFRVAGAPVSCTETEPDDLCLVVANKELILWPRRRSA